LALVTLVLKSAVEWKSKQQEAEREESWSIAVA